MPQRQAANHKSRITNPWDSSVNLHQLRIFATVARLGSFSRAAEELHISQPSVSIQVADLERALAVDLFKQGERPIRLTEAGSVLEEYARRILALVDGAEAAVKEAKHLRRPRPAADAADAEAPPLGGADAGPPFEVIEHTADVGIIAYGRSLEELFSHAAMGMMHFLIDAASVRPIEQRTRIVEAEDREGLLINWLNDLLLLLNAEGFVPARFEVRELTDTRLRADVAGEPVDLQRHRFHLDVKGATYHQLYVRKNDVWEARVIFDV